MELSTAIVQFHQSRDQIGSLTAKGAALREIAFEPRTEDRSKTVVKASLPKELSSLVAIVILKRSRLPRFLEN
jgi:hypothetical protein